MKMKKIALILTVIIVVAGVAVAGCAAPAPPPAPPPTPPPAPPPTPPPAPKPHEPVELAILTGGIGSTGYYGASAYADMLTKKHPWIKASPIEGYLSVAAVMEGGKRDPKIFLMTGTQRTTWKATHGVNPFDKKYDVKVIAGGVTNYGAWCTLDPKIKTMADCVGKKVAGYPLRIDHAQTFKYAFDSAVGIDKMELLEMAPPVKGGADALRDGLADVTVWSGSIIRDKLVPHPGLTELIATKGLDKIYFIPFDHKYLDYAIEKEGVPVAKGILPVGISGPNQKEAMECYVNDFSALFCFAGADDEVIYEVTKTVVENLDALPTYHKALATIQRETVASLLYEPEKLDQFHPGALRYYKEAGLIK